MASTQSTGTKNGDGILLGILVCCALALISLNAFALIQGRGISDELLRSKETLRQLQAKQAKLIAKEDRLRQQREQAERDKLVTCELLAHCRSAEDLPDFQSDHVIASKTGSTLILYVPAGEHRLEISTITSNNKSSVDRWKAGRDEAEINQTWNATLSGDTVYMLELIGDDATEVTAWKLTASDPVFEPRLEFVSPTGIDKRDTYGLNFVLYPNQRPSWVRKPLQEAASNPPPLPIFYTCEYKVDGNKGKMFFIGAKLYSEGPATVKATDAGSLLESDLLMPYQGGGKYELRVKQ